MAANRGGKRENPDVARKILKLAGVKDCWTFTKGKTRTTVNYAKSVFNALKENTKMRVMDYEVKKINIISGNLGKNQEPEKITKKEEET